MLIFTETWLNCDTPDEAAELADCALHRADRTPEAGTKTGGGLCTPDLEYITVAADFNQANLRSVLPNFYQSINCPTRGDKTLK